MLTTFAILIVVVIVVAVAAAPKTPGQQVASTPAASASPAASQALVTDPSGAQCVSLDSQGYCPGDDPTTPPAPTGPQQLALGQPITISDTSNNQTEGTVTVLSAMVTTQPAQSFGSGPAN